MSSLAPSDPRDLRDPQREPRRRARSRQRKASLMQQQNGGGVSDAARLIDEWRADVSQQLDDIARALQQSSIIQERLTNRLDEYDRRIKALEQAPAERERTVVGLGGLIGQYAYLLIAGVLLWLALSPHIGWH